MFTKLFWMDAAERSLKTFFQVFLAIAIEENVFNALELDWKQIIGIALGAALVSIATSVVSSTVGKHETASLIDKYED
jgi:TRAP-type uncharacterized transport system fused permease subunit